MGSIVRIGGQRLADSLRPATGSDGMRASSSTPPPASQDAVPQARKNQPQRAAIASARESLEESGDAHPGLSRGNRYGQQLVGQESQTAIDVYVMRPSPCSPVVDHGYHDQQIGDQARWHRNE